MNKNIRTSYIIKRLLSYPNTLKHICQNHISVISFLYNKKLYCDKQYIEIKDQNKIIFDGIEHPYRVHNLYPILMTSNQNIIIYYNYVMSCFGKEMKSYRFNKHNIDIFRINNSFCLEKMSLFWQYPVLTEKQFYEQNKSNPSFFPFPWATIIDKGYNLKDIYNMLNRMFQFNKPLFTCCQHIHFRILKQLWIDLGIVLVYTAHKVINEDYLGSIRLVPCPLYAVNIEDIKRNQIFQKIDYMNLERKYLYSFMGGYQPIHYLTDIRKHIFKLKDKHKDTLIINTGDWHFNCDVYGGKQNIKGDLNENKIHKDKTQFYNTVLLQSRYTLTPSGSGPNSIRFWEALAVGSIPILLADTLELPKHPLWDKSIIRIPEKLIYNIESILKKIPVDEERKRRQNCILIYNDFKNNYRMERSKLRRGIFKKNKLSHKIIKNFKNIILTRDCHGYQYYNSEYNSPTIGTCMHIPDFIYFLENINIIPELQLQFDENINKNYPVGILKIPNSTDSIRIHFMHDNNKKDIIDKWNRRVSRMDKDKSLQKYIFLNDCCFSGIIDNLDVYLDRFFNISYGAKIFFCKKSTYNKIQLSVNILNKGLIVIIPDKCKSGPAIYNYVTKNLHIKTLIFSNSNGIIN